MLPDQEFSENIGPPWKPAVWSQAPEELVKVAQLSLFQDRADIERDALQSRDRAMSGSGTSPQNESDQLISSNPGNATGSPGQVWKQTIKDMRRTEPLAAWANGAKSGPPNPNV